MAERARFGVAVLAAGGSHRFGDGDKLVQCFHGRSLGEHAVSVIPRDAFDCAWVIAQAPGHACEDAWRAAGFETAINVEAADGMGTSVALAAQRAAASGLDGLLIALADMPLVPRAHFEAILAEAGSPGDILVSARGAARMPPALFGSRHFAALAKLCGDTGARELLAKGCVINCPPHWLADIDTPQDLADLQ